MIYDSTTFSYCISTKRANAKVNNRSRVIPYRVISCAS